MIANPSDNAALQHLIKSQCFRVGDFADTGLVRIGNHMISSAIWNK